jgi:glycosyltransferase involved in cell wall biosynthesis
LPGEALTRRHPGLDEQREKAPAAGGSSMERASLAIMFHRLGPYHMARLSAVQDKCQIAAVEVTAVDSEYAWDPVDPKGLPKATLFDQAAPPEARKTFDEKLISVLRQHSARVLFVPGWGTWWTVASLRSCLRIGVRVVVMSESTFHDAPRSYLKETIKRRIVRLCSAALVGGKPQLEYLRRLGMPRERIFRGYDVVDNAHFASGAEAARLEPTRRRRALGLPDKYFLASARFIAKKNLPRLLQAYALYRDRAGTAAWKLVILGEGPERPHLEGIVSGLGVQRDVTMPGFKQYDELPAYYGLASAFIHASTVDQWGLVVNEAMATGLPVLVSERCGCAADLVRPGHNGFTFHPDKVDELADLMLELSSDRCDRAAMGVRSRMIIDDWNPAAFAAGAVAAARAALEAPERRPRVADLVLLAMLANR